MRVSEAPKQARPKGAERLHMAFQGLFTDQEGAACMSRGDKIDTPSRFGIGTASTRTASQSARTPNAIRRSAQGPSIHDRTSSPVDSSASPIRGVRKSAYSAKSPAVPYSEVNRHTNRPVYTAVGISTPKVPNVPSSKKSATPRMRTSSSSASPGHRTMPQQPQQPQPTAQDVSSKPSPAKETPLGNTTSAVIAALAMDAALPDLDATAMALLETIMGGCGTPSPCQSPSLDYMGAGPGASGKASATPALARSPLGPVASRLRPQQPQARPGPAAGLADTNRASVLTQQLLLQHQQQCSQALRQQYQNHGLDGLYTTTAAGGRGLEVAGASGVHSSGQRGLPTPLQSPCSPRCQYTPAQQKPQSGAGTLGGVDDSGTVLMFKTPPTPPTPQSPPAEPFSALPQQLQELLRPTSHSQYSQTQQPGLCIPPESSFFTSGEMGVDAKPHPGEEPLQVRTCRQLARATDSPSGRRQPNSHSAARIHEIASPKAASSAAAGASSLSGPANSSSRTLMKRLCRSHAAGNLSSRMLKSPKDDSRRPTTYAELQGASKLYLNQSQQQQEVRSPLSSTGKPTSRAQGSDLSEPVANIAPANIISSDECAEGPPATDRGPSHPSCRDIEKMSKSSSAAVTARASNGHIPGSSSLVIPESIAPHSSRRSDSKVPTTKQPPQLVQEDQQQDSVSSRPRGGGVMTTTSQPRAPTLGRRGGGLFGGLFSCFGLPSGSERHSRSPMPSPARNNDLGEEQLMPVQLSAGARAPRPQPAALATAPPQATAPSPATATPSAASPPLAAAPAPLASAFPDASEQPQVNVPPQAAVPFQPTTTVAAVAAALSISPKSAAAHVGADSRLLMLLQAELARIEPSASNGSPPSPTGPAGGGDGIKDTARPAQQQQPLEEGKPPAISPCTPRSSGNGATSRGGQQSGTPQGAAVQALPSKGSVLLGQGNCQASGMMPGNSDALANTTFVSRSAMGPHHLCYEDGDSVLRGSVDVINSGVTSLAFPPPLPVSRSQPHTRTGSSLPTGSVVAPIRDPRQPLDEAMRADATTTAAAVSGGSSGSSALAHQDFLEPLESDGREMVPGASTLSQQRQPFGLGQDMGLGITVHAQLPSLPPGSYMHANLHGQVLKRLSGSETESTCTRVDAPEGTVAGPVTATVPALRLPGLSNSIRFGTPQALRSSRKRSRATHAGFGGSALSQLDARKLAAMPLEEMLEQIQAAITAEDLAAGRMPQHATSGGGLSDGGAILPMPPVLAKARSGTLRRRKSTAGGRAMGAGCHSGGGGGGNPSRGGRSSDGGTRGGAAGVGAVQTTLMKAAATAAALGASRRRRRVKNRSPAHRQQLLSPNITSPGAPSYYFYGGQAVPVSPNRRKSDGAGNLGQQPVWRHGGRALAFGGLGIGGITSNTSPSSSAYDQLGARQPPQKRPQLCTTGGIETASASYGGAGVSPPRLRSATSLPSPPPIVFTKSPIPARTPGVAHAHIRAARRILDVDDTAVRPGGYTARLMAVSSAGKAAAPAMSAKRAIATDIAAAPMTSCLSISELLSRCNTEGLVAKSAGGALTSGNRIGLNVLGRITPHEHFDGRNECIICRGVATMGGAIPAAAAITAPSLCTLRQAKELCRETVPVTNVSPMASATQEDLLQDGPCGDSGSGEPNKPRMISVSLTELLLQASMPGKQRQPSIDRNNTAHEADEGTQESVGAGLKEQISSISSVERAKTTALKPAVAAVPDAAAAAAKLPDLLRKQELRASKGALLLHSSYGDGSTEHITSMEPARSPVGYLELLQVYGQAIGGRAATLPNCSMPTAFRATSAASGGAAGGGVRTSTTAGAGGCDSATPAQGPRPAAYSVGGRPSPVVGSYVPSETLHIHASATAAVVTADPERMPVEALVPAPVRCNAAETDVGGCASLCSTLADVASTAISPAHGQAQVASPSTSSVLGQMPSAAMRAETQGLESTAGVRSDGVRLLEDTADSGGSGIKEDNSKIEAVATGEMIVRDDGNSEDLAGYGSGPRDVKHADFDGMHNEKDAPTPELLNLLSAGSKSFSGVPLTIWEVRRSLSPTEDATTRLPLSQSVGPKPQLPSTTEDVLLLPPSSTTEESTAQLPSETKDAVPPQAPSQTKEAKASLEEEALQPPSPTEGAAPQPKPSAAVSASPMLLEKPSAPQRPSGTPFCNLSSMPFAKEGKSPNVFLKAPIESDKTSFTE